MPMSNCYRSLNTLAKATVEVENNIEPFWRWSSSDSQQKEKDDDSSNEQYNLVNNKKKQLELPIEMHIFLKAKRHP